MEVLGELVAGAVSGGMGILATHPIDVAKVRIQSSNSPYSGHPLLSVLSGTVRREGLAGLYKGIGPPMYGVAAYQAVCFSSFESSMRFLNNGGGGPSDADYTRKVVASGMVSGAATTLVTTPVELCKIQQQLAEGRGLGQETTLQCARRIARVNGPGALYHGLSATVVRDVASTGLYFYVYEKSKAKIKAAVGTGTGGQPGLVELFSGGLAGSAAWGSVVWADNIKTRIQEKLPEPRAKSTPSYFQNVIRLHKEGGIRGFFRGSAPIMVRAFPCNAVTFWTYETAKPILVPEVAINGNRGEEVE